MTKLLFEKFGKYALDKNKYYGCDHILKFENGYGVIIFVEIFNTVTLYNVTTIKFLEDNTFKAVAWPVQNTKPDLVTHSDYELFEYIQSVKDLK